MEPPKTGKEEESIQKKKKGKEESVDELRIPVKTPSRGDLKAEKPPKLNEVAVKAIEDVKELVHPFLKKKKKLKKKKSEIPDEMEKKTGSEDLSIEEISEAISFSESLDIQQLKDRLLLAEKIISSLLPVAISASKVEINEDLSKNNQAEKKSELPEIVEQFAEKNSIRRKKSSDSKEGYLKPKEENEPQLSRKKSQKRDSMSSDSSSPQLGVVYQRRKSVSISQKPPKEKPKKNVDINGGDESRNGHSEWSDKPPILTRRRTRSLIDVTNPESLENIIQRSDSEQSSLLDSNVSSALDIDMSNDSLLANRQIEAAIAIQRWYRYLKVSQHFKSIIHDALQKKKSDIIKRKSIKKIQKQQTNLSFISTFSFDSDHGETLSENRKHFIVGTRKFNLNPEKGIKYLIENNVVEENEDVIAAFLYQCPKLNKSKVGEYLALGKEFTNKVLESFVQLIDFTGLTFDQALRKFLCESNFRLAGEAQKIDRMMTEFGRHFHSHEPKIFQTEDTSFILAFSTIMLNTDAHNPSVKKKMTFKEFVRNNSGIDGGKNIPEDYLSKLYNSVIQNEIKMKEGDELVTFDSTIEGLPEPISDPNRMFIAEYPIDIIPDILARSVQKIDRDLLLFNDMLIVIKQEKKRKSEITLMTGLYKLRYQEIKDTNSYQNAIELISSNRRLGTIAFESVEKKDQFLNQLKEGVDEVNYYEESEIEKLKSIWITMEAGDEKQGRFKKLTNMLTYRHSIGKKKGQQPQKDTSFRHSKSREYDNSESENELDDNETSRVSYEEIRTSSDAETLQQQQPKQHRSIKDQYYYSSPMIDRASIANSAQSPPQNAVSRLDTN